MLFEDVFAFVVYGWLVFGEGGVCAADAWGAEGGCQGIGGGGRRRGRWGGRWGGGGVVEGIAVWGGFKRAGIEV